MTIGQQKIRKLLDSQEFGALFNELGWDHPPQDAPRVEVEDCGLPAVQIARKRGVGVWLIRGDTPEASSRRRLDSSISRQSRERLLIFAAEGEQLWLWPEQRPSGGYRLVPHRYVQGTRNDDLLQRLSAASFSIEEEGSLTVVDVLDRVRRSFSAEKVTKKFYKEFQEHHSRMAEMIEGIPSEPPESDHRSWYCSVLLNRLMFIYFLQRKSFLDDDPHYLRNRLKIVRETLGDGSYYGFFKRFLRALFHKGLGSSKHSYSDPEIGRIIGNIPYVNGGIFQPHQLEQGYHINIPDEAFEETFDFFDKYHWHLDDRPTYKPNEINPDVLGYIFEQYVNQKEQGAYYTKEDITGYMASVTVIPAYFDRLSPSEENSPWVLLSADPDRYIHESVSHGADEWQGHCDDGDAPPPPQTYSLPHALGKEIWQSLSEEERFQKAPANLGLPGESWWEVNDRIEYYLRLKNQLANDEITDVDTAVTANLNLRQVAEDYLSTLGSKLEAEHAYGILTEIKILDPTCGSGAFLFATLEILFDMYTTIIERAEELSKKQKNQTPPAFLTEAKKHPNIPYFILKTAILKNLYGLDLMPETGEIARLRLFLKLAAQLEQKEQIEPLPDLDFNIKCGNLLIGIADEEDAEQRLGTNLMGLEKLKGIMETASTYSRLYNEFIEAQKKADNPKKVARLKSNLNQNLEQNRKELDRILHKIRVEQSDPDEWVKSHRPFHWFAEFPQVHQAGGFDIVIGNPPYIRRNKVTDYIWRGYKTDGLPDIYAPCLERALQLTKPGGRFAMILPISFQFSEQFRTARKIAASTLGKQWTSTFARRPSELFAGTAKVRSTIIFGKRNFQNIQKANQHINRIFVTRLNRWIKEYRMMLFTTLRYTELPTLLCEQNYLPRIGSARESEILYRLTKYGTKIENLCSKSTLEDTQLGYKTTALYYLSTFLTEPPAKDPCGKPIKQSKVNYIRFRDPKARDAAFAFTLSKIGLLWWAAAGDEFDVTKSGLCSMPIPASPEVHAEAAAFADELQETLSQNLFYSKTVGGFYGNYDVKSVRHITDEIDRLILKSIGMEDYWEDLQLFYATFVKQTGEAGTVFKELPDCG